jgi:hypothetical protein
MAYIPAAIWFVSALICIYIARRRRVRLSFFCNLVVVLLGPFAIPLVFLAKTDRQVQVDK